MVKRLYGYGELIGSEFMKTSPFCRTDGCQQIELSLNLAANFSELGWLKQRVDDVEMCPDSENIEFKIQTGSKYFITPSSFQTLLIVTDVQDPLIQALQFHASLPWQHVISHQHSTLYTFEYVYCLCYNKILQIKVKACPMNLID